MKNKLSIFLFSLIAAFTFAACEEDEPVFDGPYDLIFSGPTSVVPGTVEAYTIGDLTNPESYSWTVAGPASIVGDASGTDVEVAFTGVGDVVLTATNGTETNNYLIEVESLEPVVASELNGTGVLASSMTDTVFLSFDAPLAKDPVVSTVTEDGAFWSGSLSALMKEDAQNYYLIYTAGEGNGTPEVLLTDIIASEAYGSDTVDSAYVELYRVDNFNPIANITVSDDQVMEGDMVMVTTTFNEAVMFANPEDSALYVTFTVDGEMMRDTLEATADPLVYTYEYIAEGDGAVELGVENVADMAGNMDVIVEADELMIDNMDPEVIETATSAVDEGDYAQIMITSTEAGTGMYLVMMADAKAVTTAEEFMAASGVASGSVNLKASALLFSGSAVANLDAGDYTVYYMVMDNAGNISSLASSSLTMD